MTACLAAGWDWKRADNPRTPGLAGGRTCLRDHWLAVGLNCLAVTGQVPVLQLPSLDQNNAGGQTRQSASPLEGPKAPRKVQISPGDRTVQSTTGPRCELV
jgi:hypothetical protein